MVTVKIPQNTREDLAKAVIGSLILSTFILSIFFHLEGGLEKFFGVFWGRSAFVFLIILAIMDARFIIRKFTYIREINREEERKLLHGLKEFFEKRGVKF